MAEPFLIFAIYITRNYSVGLTDLGTLVLLFIGSTEHDIVSSGDDISDIVFSCEKKFPSRQSSQQQPER